MTVWRVLNAVHLPTEHVTSDAVKSYDPNSQILDLMHKLYTSQ